MVPYATDLRTLVMQELLHAASKGLIRLSAAGALAAACALGQSGAQQLLKALRRQLQLHRRRRIARALNALRHDRDYLLGCLPPSVSAQVLRQLDRASLAALRATCRQCYLLVGAAASSMVVDAHALHVAASLPLEAVWPQVKAISLHLNPLQEEPELFQPAKSSSSMHQPSTTQAALQPGNDVTATPASMYIIPSKGSCWDPGVTSRVADAMLRSMLEQCGLDGLQKLQLLDMTRCRAGFSPDTWSCLARCLPSTSITLLTPLRCLLGPAATAYTSRHASATQPELLACLRHLASHAQGTRNVTLRLTGGAVTVQTQRQLHDIVTVAGPRLLAAINLVDLYPWSGSLDWTPLTHLSHLVHLSITPRTQLSIRNLLHILKRVHTLRHLSLLSGADWNHSTYIGYAELQQLQQLTQITTLEVPVIRLSKAPQAAAAAPGSNNTQNQSHSTPAQHILPALSHLRSLSFLQLHCMDRLEPHHLTTVVPNLTYLAVGICPQAQQSARHGLTASEEEAALAAADADAHQDKQQPAGPAAYPAQLPPAGPQGGGLHGPVGAGMQNVAQNAAQPQQQWLVLLQELRQLEELHVGMSLSAVLAAELAGLLHARQLEAAMQVGIAPPATNMLPSLRTLHLHHVVGYAQLYCLLSLLEHAPSTQHIGLHHITAVSPNGPLIQLPTGAQVDFKWVGAYELVEKLVSVPSLQHLEVQAGDFALTHQLCSMPPPVRCLTLAQQHMLLDGDVHDLAAAMRDSAQWSWFVTPSQQSNDANMTSSNHTSTQPQQPAATVNQQQHKPDSAVSSKEGVGTRHSKMRGALSGQRVLRLLGCKQLTGHQLEAALNGPDLLVQCTDWRVVDTFMSSEDGAFDI